MIYLVSYQHSGNTWFRYCIEYLTMKPTHGHQKFSISERNNNFLDIDIKAKPIAIKRHELIKNEIKNNDTFVLILRHPSSCIKVGQDVNKEFLKYYKLITEYEKFKGIKHIFYYKDLFDLSFLSNIQILDLKIIFDRFYKLYVNFEYHKENCISIYDNERHEIGANLDIISNKLLNNEYIINSNN